MKLLPVKNRVEIDKVGTDGQTVSLNIDEVDKLKTLEWYRTIKQSFVMSSMIYDAMEMKRHINQKEWSITSMTESGTPSRYSIEAQRNGMALINLHRTIPTRTIRQHTKCLVTATTKNLVTVTEDMSAMNMAPG